MPQMKLKAYHFAWLEAHPGRDADWLKDKLLDGFDVHHLDGDHDNNEPLNLVLVEAVDHMRLHGMVLKNGITSWRKAMSDRAREKWAAVAPVPILAAPDLDEMSALAYMSRSGRS